MRKILFTLLIFTNSLLSQSLESKIAKMVVIGFTGYDLNETNPLYTHLKKYPLGGVILFDKNIKDQTQLKSLTAQLNFLSKNNLLITIDEEGGRVSRLGKVEGFRKTPSAKQVASLGKLNAKMSYEKMALMLSDVGINCNLAPSVDLAINPKNQVIVKNNRSFSKNQELVSEFASIFMREMQKQGVLSVIKHFPGHGSSLGDSHDGFVDVTNTWSYLELVPFETLIKSKEAKMIMTAHIYNKNLDPLYPATLSYSTNQTLLREKLGFDGVLISDDLQMGAISKNYTLSQTLKLSINSGVDLLLFANQIDKPVSIKEIVDIVLKLINSGDIDIKTIDRANKRVDKLKRGLS